MFKLIYFVIQLNTGVIVEHGIEILPNEKICNEVGKGIEQSVKGQYGLRLLWECKRYN